MASPSAGRLTALTVKNAGPGKHSDSGGLWLVVGEGQSGARSASWVYRFQIGGRESVMGLGSASVVSLKAAREMAAKLRLQAQRARVDPTELHPLALKRRAQAAAKPPVRPKAKPTFKAVAFDYLAAHEPSLKNAKHVQQWRNTLRDYAFPILGAMPVDTIEASHLVQVLSPIWQSKPETASRVRSRIAMILDAAKAAGHRNGENPARWKGHLQLLLGKRTQAVVHHPALPWAELPVFMLELRAQEGIGARALEFTILTAARTGEAIDMLWSEIDLDAKLWVVPAVRMKMKRLHRVPLSDAAIAVVDRVQAAREVSDHVFPGSDTRKPLSNMSMAMLLRRMGRTELTVHGFRSTFRDWCAEATSFPRELAEMALAHVNRDKVEAAYLRADLLERRRELMAAWGRFVTSPPGEAGQLDLVRAVSR